MLGGMWPLRPYGSRPKAVMAYPCPPVPQEALFALQRVEWESPSRPGSQTLASTLLLPLPSGSHSAQLWTDDPHSGQINSLLPREGGPQGCWSGAAM